jgi:dihydromethanopterin reductase (acceptor)
LARIGWGITGGGHFLLETFDVMEKLAEKHEISCFVSSAAEQVIQIYGLREKLNKICPGDYYREVISATNEGPAAPLVGRFLRRTYRALIISPATSNTVAKVVSGISDTLVTNAIAQAEKGKVPVMIIPTDQRSGETKTRLPYIIDRRLCEECESCQIIDLCPTKAIVLSNSLPKIDLSKCVGCGICLEKCPRKAVSFGQEVPAVVRKIDVKNVETLRNEMGFIVLTDPREIPNALIRVLGDEIE